MEVYFGTVFIVLFILLLYRLKLISKKNAAIIIALIAVAVTGLRYNVGSDYIPYTSSYQSYKKAGINDFGKIGLYITSNIAAFFRDDYATWFFLMAVITVGLFMISIYRYSINWEGTIILFFLMGGWASTLNIVKQSCAIAILLFSQEFLIRKKPYKWAIACIIASTFHISALLMVPMYFVINSDITFWHILQVAIICILIRLNINALVDLFGMLKGIELDAGADIVSRNVNVIRILTLITPALLYYLVKDRVDESDAKIKIWCNMTILTAALSITLQSSVYLTRFVEYFSDFNMYTIPYLLSQLKKRDRFIATIITFTLYGIMFYFDMNKSIYTRDFHWIFER